MKMNCFCCMVDQRKAFSLISSRDHCQRSSPSRISDTQQAGFEPAQNLSSSFVEWSCAVFITTIPTCSVIFVIGYVKEGLPFAHDLSLENSANSYLCFWLALLHSVSWFFFFYWSPSLTLCTVFDSISSNIDEVLSINPSANAFVFGDSKGTLADI